MPVTFPRRNPDSESRLPRGGKKVSRPELVVGGQGPQVPCRVSLTAGSQHGLPWERVTMLKF